MLAYIVYVTKSKFSAFCNFIYPCKTICLEVFLFVLAYLYFRSVSENCIYKTTELYNCNVDVKTFTLQNMYM
jgi:hypothetical protein